jgi:hypothetical protein
MSKDEVDTDLLDTVLEDERAERLARVLEDEPEDDKASLALPKPPAPEVVAWPASPAIEGTRPAIALRSRPN